MKQRTSITGLDGDALPVYWDASPLDNARAVFSVGGVHIDLAGIAALRVALDKAEATYRERTKKPGSVVVATDVRLPPDALEPVPTNMADIERAVAWVRERRAEGKKRMLIVFRDLDGSPNAKHPDNEAFITAMGEDHVGDWYCLTTRHIGFMEAATDAVYCCNGVAVDESHHLARLAPVWTADGWELTG